MPTNGLEFYAKQWLRLCIRLDSNVGDPVIKQQVRVQREMGLRKWPSSLKVAIDASHGLHPLPSW